MLGPLLVALGIALGAFGAHGLADQLAALGHKDTWQTAAYYHLLMAVAIACLERIPGQPKPPLYLLATGTLIFSGTLYALSLSGIKILGAITPIGGVLMIASWLWIAFARKPKSGA